jgi:hypothetical protein
MWVQRTVQDRVLLQEPSLLAMATDQTLIWLKKYRIASKLSPTGGRICCVMGDLLQEMPDSGVNGVLLQSADHFFREEQ